MLLQVNRKVSSKNFTTRREQLSIFKQSTEESGLVHSGSCKTQNIKSESEKTEYANNDVEQMQTSWLSKGSANGNINLENGKSQLWKSDEQKEDIFLKNIESTNKVIHNESILSANLVKEKDKIDSSYRDYEKLGTVSAHSNLRKEIIDNAVENLATELDTSTTKNTEMKENSLPDVYSRAVDRTLKVEGLIF